jgi:hypothetical protein
MKKTLFSTLVILFLIISFSCNKCNNEANRVKHVNIAKEDTLKIKIHRYEKALFAVDVNDLKNGLKKLLPEYSFFIPDSVLKNPSDLQGLKDYLADPLMISLNNYCQQIYPDLKEPETKLSKALTYYKHYFPERRTPKVFTYVSGLYYEEPIKYADSVLLIGLDMYLGSSCKYYSEILGARYSIPGYVQKRYRQDYLMPDCMRAIAKTAVDNSQQTTRFIDYIIYEGKILYFMDAMLPETPDSLKMYYSASQMNWCIKNEAKAWSYIIDQKLLYTTNTNIIAKLCADAPFTSVFSRQSPPQVGIWLGWQIVRSYMENNPKVTINDLFLDQDAQEILTKAKYKPKK